MMRYTIHHCDSEHPATFLPYHSRCSLPDELVPARWRNIRQKTRPIHIHPNLYKIADDIQMTDVQSRFAVAAYAKSHMVGLFKYDFKATTDVMHACGTAVMPTYRMHGMAVALWRAALRRVRPASVKVAVVSEGGFRLVATLETMFPQHRWVLCDLR